MSLKNLSKTPQKNKNSNPHRNNVLRSLPEDGLMDHKVLQILLLDDNNLHGLPLQLGKE